MNLLVFFVHILTQLVTYCAKPEPLQII
jgi:hypothetical protein